MTQDVIKKERAGIFKSFLEKIVTKYPTWNSFVEGMKKDFKIGMFLDKPLDNDVIFETELFDYHYFNINDESSTRKVGEEVKDSLLTKSQAYTVLANEIYLLKQATHATQIKFDDYKVGFLGVQDQAPQSIVYFEEPQTNTIGCIGVSLFGNMNGGVGAQHYRIDKYSHNQDVMNESAMHLRKGSTIFCK